jgi:hypothetical protein
MEDIGIFYGHLVYFTAIWSILLPFGLFYCHLVYFTAIWSILLPFVLFYCHLVYFTAIWSILWPFGIYIFLLLSPEREIVSRTEVAFYFYARSRVPIKAIWYILCTFFCIFFSHFGMLYREKSGNPSVHTEKNRWSWKLRQSKARNYLLSQK